MNIHVDDNNEVLLGVQTDEIDLRAGDTINIGTSDYEDLDNKPSINDVELVGDLDSDDLGLADANHTHVKADVTDFAHNHTKSEITDFPTIPTKTSDLDNDSGFVTTDENVKQLSANAPSYSYWRPLPVGEASSGTEGFTPATKTGGTYTFPTLQAQPSTGTIRMGKASFYKGSYTHKLSPTTLTENRTATLPDKSGTLAMTDDIPPKVIDIVEYDDYDPSDYDDDIDLICASLCQDDGCYRVVLDGFVYYVFTQKIELEDETLLRQTRWGTEEGALVDSIFSVNIEDGEVTDIESTTYMTYEQAFYAFATINHKHWTTESGADTVWDYCDTNDSKFNTNNSCILYKDTTNNKSYIIDVGYLPMSPYGKYQRVQPFDDASHFYQRIATRVGSTFIWESWKEFVDKDTYPHMFSGTSSTAAGTGTKVVVCPDFKASDLKVGTMIAVTFDEANSAAVGDLALNVNGTGAYGIKQNKAGTIGNFDDKSYLKANTYPFIFNGSYWVTWYNTDTNTIGYNIRTNSLSLPMKNDMYRYRIAFTSADGEGYVSANASSSTSGTAKKTVTTEKINPHGRIVYYATTAAVTAGNRPSVTYMYSQYYTITLGYSFNRTGSALTMTAWKPVYVKCSPQADGSAIIDPDNPFVQAQPTTNDGYIYIFLGVATSATAIEMTLEHPVYYHDGTALRRWTGPVS